MGILDVALFTTIKIFTSCVSLAFQAAANWLSMEVKIFSSIKSLPLPPQTSLNSYDCFTMILFEWVCFSRRRHVVVLHRVVSILCHIFHSATQNCHLAQILQTPYYKDLIRKSGSKTWLSKKRHTNILATKLHAIEFTAVSYYIRQFIDVFMIISVLGLTSVGSSSFIQSHTVFLQF